VNTLEIIKGKEVAMVKVEIRCDIVVMKSKSSAASKGFSGETPAAGAMCTHTWVRTDQKLCKK